MLCEAILVDADYRSRVERKVICFMEGDTLWRTIDKRNIVPKGLK